MARSAERDRRTEAFWRRMARRQADSGLSVRAWCRRHRLAEPTFYNWRARPARRHAGRPALVPVPVVCDPPCVAAAAHPSSAAAAVQSLLLPKTGTPGVAVGRIEIELPGDRRGHVVGPVDRRALADVLTVLATPACPAEGPGC